MRLVASRVAPDVHLAETDVDACVLQRVVSAHMTRIRDLCMIRLLILRRDIPVSGLRVLPRWRGSIAAWPVQLESALEGEVLQVDALDRRAEARGVGIVDLLELVERCRSRHRTDRYVEFRHHGSPQFERLRP